MSQAYEWGAVLERRTREEMIPQVEGTVEPRNRSGEIHPIMSSMI